MLVSKPLIIMDRIHVYLFQVAWLTYMQTFTIGGFQMLIEKVNMYDLFVVGNHETSLYK
jgi:hypothetical protein